jgi:hypothetical protein
MSANPVAVVPQTEADELSLIRTTYAKDLTDAEFGLLVADARHRGLSVVKREVVGIKFQGRMTPYVTLAGARTLAERSGRYAGGQGPYFCGPDGVWLEVWLDARTPPAAAKFIVHRHDQVYPSVGIATWGERNQPNSPTWKGMPSVMLGKVAEMDALRRARLIDDVPVFVGDATDEALVGPSAKAGAMRHLHGVGQARGLDHGQLRTVVAAVRPGTASMAEEGVGAADLGAAAGLIDALDDAALAAIVATPEGLAAPEGHPESTPESVVASRLPSPASQDARRAAEARGLQNAVLAAFALSGEAGKKKASEIATELLRNRWWVEEAEVAGLSAAQIGEVREAVNRWGRLHAKNGREWLEMVGSVTTDTMLVDVQTAVSEGRATDDLILAALALRKERLGASASIDG